MQLKTVMTETEILAALHESDLPPEVIAEISQFINGYTQGIYNLLKFGQRSTALNLTNYPDNWGKGHNKLVSIVQSYD